MPEDIMLNLGIYEDVFNDEFSGKEFSEFCYCLDLMSSYGSPRMYLEVVQDDPHTLRKRAEKTLKNTRETTRDLGGAYLNIIDANGNLIKSAWNLLMKFINMIIRAIAFIINKISMIPNGILHLTEKIEKIPSDIRNKIKGNIQLYITAGDVAAVYNNSLVSRLNAYITILAALSKGDLWGTFFGRIQLPVNGREFRINQNDMKLCKKLDALYSGVRNLRFEHTTIEMSNKENIDLYFGSSKAVSFVDLSGKRHQCSYYEALNQLIHDLETKKAELSQVQKDFGAKYDRTRMNQEFAKMGPIAQQRIADVMEHTTKIVSIVGDIIRYITTDIKTIDNATKKLAKKNAE